MDKKITPMPWEAFTEDRFSGWYAIREKDGGEVGSGDGGFTKEDAAFIVKAVNSHDSLINALTLLSEKVRATGDWFAYADELTHAQAAIEKAEGK